MKTDYLHNINGPKDNILILDKGPLLAGEKLEDTLREKLFHSYINIKWIDRHEKNKE